MKLKWKLGIAIPIAMLVICFICWLRIAGFRDWVRMWVYFVTRETELTIHPPPPRCKVREVDYNSKRERIERDAKNALRIGTRREDVIRFFFSEKIPVTFEQIAGQNEASGEIDIQGDAECGSLACGNDSALIGVRVNVDENGTVLSDPVVIGMYTDCL
jgi:hypothetical protein